MGEEATANSTEIQNAEIIAAEGSPEIGGEYKPLFETDIPTEAELRGYDEGEEVEQEKDATEAADTEGEKGETETPKEGEEGKKKESVKPPEGYVPIASLHEERALRKESAAEVERLYGVIEALKKLPAETDGEKTDPDFKVLTEAEEDDLMEQDIFAYQKYQRSLRKHEQAKVELTKQAEAEERIVTEGFTALSQTIPGLLDEGNDINAKLTAFAEDHGLDSSVISIITDPRTKVVIHGKKEPVLLGKVSANIAGFINAVYQKAQSANSLTETDIRTKIEKELTPIITEKVTKELMGKFKDKSSYRSIGEVPGTGDIPKTGTMSEDDFRRMTPEQVRIALGGA